MKREAVSLKAIVLTIAILCSFVSFSQEQESAAPAPPANLQESFDFMMEKYSSYEIYKVIPITKLNEFWGSVDDSLRSKERSIDGLQGEIVALNAMIDSLNSELATVKTTLKTSKETNSEIAFLGISFDKTIYHVMVWAIIVLLAVLIVMVYFMYVRSNGLTSRFKKDLEAMRKE